MTVPEVDRLVAGVSRPLYTDVPYEWEYALWYQIPQFPVLVRISAYTPVPRA